MSTDRKRLADVTFSVIFKDVNLNDVKEVAMLGGLLSNVQGLAQAHSAQIGLAPNTQPELHALVREERSALPVAKDQLGSEVNRNKLKREQKTRDDLLHTMKVVEECGWRMQEVARRLGISDAAAYMRIRRCIELGLLSQADCKIRWCSPPKRREHIEMKFPT